MDEDITMNNEYDGDNGSETSEMKFSIFDVPDNDVIAEEEDMEALINEFQNTIINSETCARCGGDTHLEKDCYASHDINNNLITDETQTDSE